MEDRTTHFPAPFEPITAIRESRPTSIFTPLSTGRLESYPKDASDNCKIGGDILSQSGNLIDVEKVKNSPRKYVDENIYLNFSVSSSSGG